jgi:hypothetical protein
VDWLDASEADIDHMKSGTNREEVGCSWRWVASRGAAVAVLVDMVGMKVGDKQGRPWVERCQCSNSRQHQGHLELDRWE